MVPDSDRSWGIWNEGDHSPMLGRGLRRITPTSSLGDAELDQSNDLTVERRVRLTIFTGQHDIAVWLQKIRFVINGWNQHVPFWPSPLRLTI
jgi:hypothetical protein